MIIDARTSEHRLPLQWRGRSVSMSALIREHLLGLEIGDSVEVTEMTNRYGLSVDLEYIRVAVHRWRRYRKFKINRSENGMMVTRVELERKVHE